MSSQPTFYVTTPIYYVNARPHLGHTYTTVATDAIARRQRALGFDTWFLTGTDEHGQKIQRSARTQNKSPKEFADAISSEFRGLWDRMGLTYDDFIRTTEARHKHGVQKLFTRLKERGFIYKGRYSGQYCVSDELYVDALPGAPCPDCGRITETISEENYYFKLSAFENWLLKYYEDHPDFIQPEARRNEVIAFVRGGLRDLSISRTSFDWGIPVPGDEKHVIYVWLDALANYLTALGFGSDAPDEQARFQKYWPAHLQIIGKEISRFHCVYWPAFLQAAGLPLPKTIFAHGWLLFEQSKMSKSRGNIVRAETILDVLGADALRYFLLREIVFGQDGSFSFDALVQRYNADLANGYGNLASRTLTMIEKYFDGKVPAGNLDADLAQASANVVNEAGAAFDRLDFSLGLQSVWTLVSLLDGYITQNAPWKLGSSESPEDRARLADILYTSAESLRIITALVYPILPEAAGKVWAQLGLGDIEEAARTVKLKTLPGVPLEAGNSLGKIGPVFPRAEKDAVTLMQDIEIQNAPPTPEPDAPHTPEASAVATLPPGAIPPAATPAATAPVPPRPAIRPTSAALSAPAASIAAVPPASDPITPVPVTTDFKITIDDFLKVELRVAQIKVAERVPKADKLLRLEVDLGYETRQILAGIAEAYSPESLVGRKVVIVANLAPRKLRGLESNGMLVAASLGEGKPVLAGFLEDIELGARLK